jgi:hypothetical protein
MEDALKRALVEIKGGDVGRACRALGSLGVVDLTPEVKEVLRDKHPTRAADEAPLELPAFSAADVPRFKTEDVEELIYSKSERTGGGADGWCYRDLQAALRTARRKNSKLDVDELLSGITAVVQFLADGRALRFRERVARARLVPLRKKAGADDPRPVGIGQLFVAIAATLLQRQEGWKDGVREAVGPTDLAHGVSGGVEAVPHIVRAYLALNPTHTVVKVDVKNAFPSLSRQAALDTGKTYPSAAPLIATLYGGATEVRCDGPAGSAPFELHTDMGVTQGEPLGGPVYSTAQRPAVDATLAAHPRVRATGIADDKYFMGLLADVLAAVATYKAELAKLALELQLHKCVAYSPAGAAAIQAACAAAGIQAEDGVMVAGSPVGTPAFVEDALRAAVDGCEQRMRLIAQVWTRGSLQLEFAAHQTLRLINLCVAPAAINYLLRTVPPEATRAQARRFDRAVYRLLLTVLGEADNEELDIDTPAGALCALRAQLHTSGGGLGFTSAEATREAAYAGSVALTGHLVRPHLGEDFNVTEDGARALPEFDALVQRGLFRDVEGLENMDIEAALEAPMQQVQRQVTQAARAPAVKAVLDRIEEPQAKAVFLSGQEEGGLFLLANAARYRPLGLNNEQMIVAVKARLGIPVLAAAEPVPCPHCPPHTIKPDGGHVFGCKEAGQGGARALRSRRHKGVLTQLAAQLGRIARGAVHAKVTTEPPLRREWERHPNAPPLRTRRTQDGREIIVHERGDVLVESQGRKVVLDLVITYPKAYKPSGAVDARMTGTPGHAADLADRRKKAHYKRRWLIDQSATRFRPFAVETGGRLHPDARAYLRERVAAYVSEEEPKEWTAQQKELYASTMSGMLIAISAATARGTATALLHIQSRVRRYAAGGAAAAIQPQAGDGSSCDSDTESSDGEAGA